MIEWQWPWALLLLPLPLLVYALFPAAKTRRQAALKVPNIEDFAAVSGAEHQQRGHRYLKWLMLLSWLLLILASARPMWVGEQIELPVSGRDLMLAVDLSGSMQVEDFNINGQAVDRLTALKYVARDFIQKRKGDRLGLILFGRKAYLQTPLTFDLNTVTTLLMESAIGLAGKETAIGDAIGLAIKRLKDKKKGSRVLILLTDGANTAGELTPIKAAQLAARHGLKIYTIGIGADEMVRESIFGLQRVNPSQDLDEKTLTAIAQKTGGRYFRARNTEDLQKIYSLLDQLEPVEVDKQTLHPRKSLFYWPLAGAVSLAFLIAWLQLADRRRT